MIVRTVATCKFLRSAGGVVGDTEKDFDKKTELVVSHLMSFFSMFPHFVRLCTLLTFIHFHLQCLLFHTRISNGTNPIVCLSHKCYDNIFFLLKRKSEKLVVIRSISWLECSISWPEWTNNNHQLVVTRFPLPNLPKETNSDQCTITWEIHK